MLTNNILKPIILLAFGLLLFAVAPAQIPTQFYKHMEGTINENLPIVMNLENNDGQLSGTYYYKRYGIPIRIEGTLEGSSVNLTEQTWQGKTTGKFSGTFNASGSIIQGTWSNPDGTRSFPFRLTENYNNAIEFESYTYTDKYHFKGKPDNPAMTVELQYFYPVSYVKNHSALTKMRNQLETNLFGQLAVHGQPETCLKKAAESSFDEYKEMEDEFGDDEEPFMMEWEYDMTTHIELNDFDILSYSDSYYSFSGGAHGMYGIAHYTFDMKTGQQLGLEDILIAGYEDQLSNLLSERLLEDVNAYSEGTVKTLVEHGFWDDKINPTDNFYIAKNGLTFTYNPYEIAPYAVGSVVVFLPFKELSNILKPGNPVEHLYE